MRTLIVKLAIGGLLIVGAFQFAYAKTPALADELRTTDRAVVFAIQREAQAIHIDGRKDICIAFGHGLDIHEKAVVAELENRNLKIHHENWCSRGPRGLNIAVVAPIRETSPGTYEFVVEVGDLSMPEGAHFATLLRRGTYMVHCEGSSEPQLVSYRQTCCP
jgi:hypothetical protein